MENTLLKRAVATLKDDKGKEIGILLFNVPSMTTEFAFSGTALFEWYTLGESGDYKNYVNNKEKFGSLIVVDGMVRQEESKGILSIAFWNGYHVYVSSDRSIYFVLKSELEAFSKIFRDVMSTGYDKLSTLQPLCDSKTLYNIYEGRGNVVKLLHSRPVSAYKVNQRVVKELEVYSLLFSEYLKKTCEKMSESTDKYGVLDLNITDYVDYATTCGRAESSIFTYTINRRFVPASKNCIVIKEIKHAYGKSLDNKLVTLKDIEIKNNEVHLNVIFKAFGNHASYELDLVAENEELTLVGYKESDENILGTPYTDYYEVLDVLNQIRPIKDLPSILNKKDRSRFVINDKCIQLCIKLLLESKDKGEKEIFDYSWVGRVSTKIFERPLETLYQKLESIFKLMKFSGSTLEDYRSSIEEVSLQKYIGINRYSAIKIMVAKVKQEDISLVGGGILIYFGLIHFGKLVAQSVFVETTSEIYNWTNTSLRDILETFCGFRGCPLESMADNVGDASNSWMYELKNCRKYTPMIDNGMCRNIEILTYFTKEVKNFFKAVSCYVNGKYYVVIDISFNRTYRGKAVNVLAEYVYNECKMVNNVLNSTGINMFIFEAHGMNEAVDLAQKMNNSKELCQQAEKIVASYVTDGTLEKDYNIFKHLSEPWAITKIEGLIRDKLSNYVEV